MFRLNPSRNWPPADLALLIREVTAALRSDRRDIALANARVLAAFTNADLTELQEALLELHEYYPGYMFRGANPGVGRKLIDRLDRAAKEHDSPTGHLLDALAWVGSGDVVELFARWRKHPPEWRSQFHRPPERYAECAGWELDDRSQKRPLFFEDCYALVRSRCHSGTGPVSTCLELGDACRWCGQPLTALFKFDLSDERLGFVPFRGRHLTIATCLVCTAFADALHMTVTPDGGARWYPGNVRPKYLPEPGSWGLPANNLELASKPQLPLRAVFWKGSQVGGAPGWVFDPAHGRCPECGKGFVFLAQLDVWHVAGGDGVFYALMCPDCAITTVRYQQT
jgi:hypothetical protein